MSEGKTRRGFMNTASEGATAARSLARGAKSAEAKGTSDRLSEPRRYLEPFGYAGVRPMDGMLRRQYLATREYFYNLPDDHILKGVQRRAGCQRPETLQGRGARKTWVPFSGNF